MRYGEAGQSHLLPFLGAAALFAALTITAHSVVLGLAAVIAGPVPAAQTALSLSRRAVSGAAQEAASVAEAAPESTGTAASRPEAAAPTGGIESYLVELLGDDARPEGVPLAGLPAEGRRDRAGAGRLPRPIAGKGRLLQRQQRR